MSYFKTWSFSIFGKKKKESLDFREQYLPYQTNEKIVQLKI